MKHVKSLLLTALILLLTASLAACSGGNTSADTAAGTETAAPTETVTEAGSEIPVDAPTDAPTEVVTEPVTETPTEAPTEAASETAAESETQPVNPFEEYLKMDEVTDVTIPEDSSVMSWELANQLLSLCADYDFEHAGFEVLARVNYDKDPQSPEHTCAFMVGRKTVTYKGESRTVVLTAVRGTSGGEWYSNFDVLPERNYDSAYAENFRLTAQNVYETLKPILNAEDNPLILICGHSRGASCANLLGSMVNADFDPANVFCYTYATPATVRGSLDVYTGNIFNFINPCDVVPRLPLSEWGYTRVGTDYVLPALPDDVKRVNDAMSVLTATAAGVESYYNDKHNLKGAGLSEDGVTTFEMMNELGKTLAEGNMMGEPAGGAGAASGFDMRFLFMSQDSDLYPFMQIVMGLMQDDNAGMMRVLINHLPSTYQKMMKLARNTAGQ